MISLYDELAEKLRRDPRRTKRGGPRFDISLLLFNARETLRDLWRAAEEVAARGEREGHPEEALAAAVEKLRPIFGERKDPRRP